ncbi:MAG: HlyC/CorC family transporter [Candidatus Cloacimonetes bacterium HGW-Cloacimonetes-2]|jgi:CBS domain containing-hemolysin-like protein|nr:MAG: HlyC/CorC family transporter [Candidatus Cloacimonetes bacterium HGW-Cloacimonetes-2]
MELLLTLLILLFFLSLSFLFSGFETGIISINQINLELEARKNKSRAQLLSFVRQPDKFLGTTLIGNNIVNVLLSTISTYLVHRFSGSLFDPRWTALIMGTIVLIFGEIVPKALFRDHSETFVPSVFPIIRFFYFILRPFVAVVSWLNRSLRKMLGIEDEDNFNYLTKDDLSLLLSEANDSGISEPQMEMIEDALDFNELDAKNVMVPRTDIIAIPDTATIEEALEVAREEGFTRYPVYHESIDNVIGILIIYDILKRETTSNTTAGDLVHEPYFAPENTDLDVLLREMQRLRKSMAIIVDSYGGTAGLVTIEDILEEIVGEIEDEYDVEEPSEELIQISPNTWLAEADLEIDVLADDYGIELPEGDYETIAGLILDRLEQIPHQGQIIDCEDYRLQVLQATDKKIIKVKIHRKKEV